MDVLQRTLAAAPPEATTLRAWWDATAVAREAESTPIDRALIGGALADRLGFAFAGGYHEALRSLVPWLSGVTALCATEEGGNTPKAIATTLTQVSHDGYRLVGRKKWATVASEASALLVVAKIGTEAGRNVLRVVHVRADLPGVKIIPSSAPFIPEIPHAEVELDTYVADNDILPGDGYDDYLKPFRTVEDLHVHGALLGYLIGVVRRHAIAGAQLPALFALASATRALAAGDTRAATTHVALAGVLEHVARTVGEIETAWSAVGGDEWTRWQRDRALLKVAGAARTARLARAREQLGVA